MKERLWKSLSSFGARDCGDYIELELPVVLHFAGILLTLRIYPINDDEGYYVLDDGTAFLEFSCDTEYYFRMFEADDKRYHFDIGVADRCFFKQYEPDFSARVALDEFVRFFVYLDDYILGNQDKVYGLDGTGDTDGDDSNG